MSEATPNTIYLKDYRTPNYLVESVDLYFELDPENCLVRSTLNIYRNPANNVQNSPLELMGEALALESIKLDGEIIGEAAYTADDKGLTIQQVPEKFQLEIVTHIDPKANTALEGLYLSSGLFCTQCEAEGFRKISYFPDRPDVMARYTTTIIADKESCPVLLSNGNKIDSGELKEGRHWVKWEDPHPKPSYLFALVAGKLAVTESNHTTPSGREVTLQIFVEPHDLDKCDHAMQSLKKAMEWDEQTYGREYDLDLYMIVAVSHFNMGAMENKGLNVFNTKFVLARPDTATDRDYEGIEAVIAHEYFHNWSGNRVTCRDWFQLSLKEGFTVFRDQMFSADQTSHAVKRIEDVNLLRTRQFPEDSGPMAHPIRPDSYIEINNFYTVTIYEKGAEVVRMLHTLLGAEGFRKGSDLYFNRHDGQAVTTDDFVKAMEDANDIALNQFRLWYGQAGTPLLEVSEQFDSARGHYSLTLKQSCPDTPGQSGKKPMHIPVEIGLLRQDGSPLPVTLEGEPETSSQNKLLQLSREEETFHFTGLPEKPIVSLLRNFSAPVHIKMARSAEEQAFLFAHDPDEFNRWEAGQQLASDLMLGQIESGKEENPILLINAFKTILEKKWKDSAYLTLLLTLPSEAWLAEQMEVVDPIAIHNARKRFKKLIATAFEATFLKLHQTSELEESGNFSSAAVGRRALKNCCLSYLMALQTEEHQAFCLEQYKNAGNMTDQIAALSLLCQEEISAREEALNQFYEQWKSEPLVIDKWFTLQATSSLPSTAEVVNQLLEHSDFDLKTPNRVRALIGAFSQANPLHFHAENGSGYQFLGDQICALDPLNPQVASRMAGAFTQWRRFDENKQQRIKEQLKRIKARENISPDLYEVVSKSLN
jgi:aminopeptidase N